MARSGSTTLGTDAAAAAGLLLLGGLLFLIGVGLVDQWQESAARNQAFTVDQYLGVAAATAGGALLLWWLASLAGAAAGLMFEIRGKARAAAVARRMSPAFMQRLVVAAVSFQLLSGAAANAAVPGPQWAPTSPVQESTEPTPGERPTAPSTAAPSVTGPSVTGPASTPETREPAARGNTEQPAEPPAPEDTPGPNAPAEVAVAPSPAPASTFQPGWQPSAPVVEPGLLAGSAVRGGHAAHGGGGDKSVAVRAGDSLWGIAADHLGPGASDVAIALEWPRWFEANKHLIGHNPDVLLPGQVLLPPAPA